MLIDVLGETAGALASLAECDERPTCSKVSRTEIVRGLRAGERGAAEALFSVLQWMPVTEPISRLAGEFGRQYRRSHTGIGAADLIVAANSQLLSLELGTHSVKHIPMFPGLRPPY